MIDPTRLADLEEIRRLKARYFLALDSQDWKGFRATFADDARIGPIESGFPADLRPSTPGALDPIAPGDVDAFVRRVAANSVGRITVHHGHQPDIEFTETNEAAGVWAMEDVLVWPEDKVRFRGTGHYWETYRRENGVWKITSMRLTRLYAYAESL